jgi:hypothetical protein
MLAVLFITQLKLVILLGTLRTFCTSCACMVLDANTGSAMKYIYLRKIVLILTFGNVV